MNTLIAYASKHGAAKHIAELLSKEIGTARLIDLGRGETISMDGYDCVVLGSSLMAGSVRKELKTFIAANKKSLETKRLGLFVSGLQASGEAEYLKQNFPPELLSAAKAKAFLGGIFDPKKCSFVERGVIKAVAKLDAYTDTIDPARIHGFAEALLKG